MTQFTKVTVLDYLCWWTCIYL